jgi:MerR family transcriptional regulator, thiopeptide resistance regulator
LDQHVYHIGEFAQKAAVSIRTLRFYDKVGLLSPSGYTEAGYRLYTDTDFFRLQQILAMKFLGFSLGEVKQCLEVGLGGLQESLALQKAMMQEKREQLDTVIQAIDETEKLLTANIQNWQAIVRVIQVIQMQQQNDWRTKYFSEEQLKQMSELSKNAYTDEQREKLAEWGKNWSEEDQQAADQQWGEVNAELKRLVAAGSDPASPEAQALAEQHQRLIGEFTHGDAGVVAGLQNWWQGFEQLPAEAKPFPSPYSQEEWDFLHKAVDIYRQKRAEQ